jgi:hypothetical protein
MSDEARYVLDRRRAVAEVCSSSLQHLEFCGHAGARAPEPGLNEVASGLT